MALTLRQQLAKGSTWCVTEDFEYIDKFNSTWDYIQAPGTHRMVKQMTKTVSVKVPKGATLTVIDKSSSGSYYLGDGLFFPVHFSHFTYKDSQRHYVDYTDASKYFELIEGVKQSVFVLYSASKGYINKIAWSHEDNKIADKNGVVWTDKLSKAMKKKRQQDAKQFILENTGYYNGIDTGSIYYVFEPSGKDRHLPDDLVIQEVDKDTKSVIDTFESKPYRDKMFRLRPIVQTYGAPARNLFKVIEEKNEQYEAIVLFKENDETTALGQLKSELKAMGLKKTEYTMKSDVDSMVIGFKDKSVAVGFKLVASSVDSQIINPVTLEELVG